MPIWANQGSKNRLLNASGKAQSPSVCLFSDTPPPGGVPVLAILQAVRVVGVDADGKQRAFGQVTKRTEPLGEAGFARDCIADQELRAFIAQDVADLRQQVAMRGWGRRRAEAPKLICWGCPPTAWRAQPAGSGFVGSGGGQLAQACVWRAGLPQPAAFRPASDPATRAPILDSAARSMAPSGFNSLTADLGMRTKSRSSASGNRRR